MVHNKIYKSTCTGVYKFIGAFECKGVFIIKIEISQRHKYSFNSIVINFQFDQNIFF